MKLYELKKYNKNIHVITLISLIITIVILIILATVVINIAVGENGIFTKAKEAKKAQVIAEAKEKIGTEILAAQIEAIERDEELEQAQIADIVSNYGELQEDGDKIILKENAYEVSLKEIYTGTVTVTSTGSYSELKAQNALLKQQLEDATKSQSESSKELSELKEILEQTTATESQILKDYTAYKDGNLITGTIENKGELNWNPSASTTYTIPSGYYSGGTIGTTNAYSVGNEEGANSSRKKYVTSVKYQTWGSGSDGADAAVTLYYNDGTTQRLFYARMPYNSTWYYNTLE